MAKYEIVNIRRGKKANQTIGTPDRSHVLFAEVHCDGVKIIGADLDYCVGRVKEMIDLDRQADIITAMRVIQDVK